MLNCNLCIIAIVFLIANIFTIVSCNSDNYKQNFKNVLTKQQNLIYEKIKAIHLGTFFGDIDTILKESAISYAKFINLFTNSKIVLIFISIIASVIYSLKKIKNNNKARDDVEFILKGLLFASSLIGTSICL